MTGNKDQLEDFEEFNGGSVTFGVPQLMTRVDSLEKDLKQTKLTMRSAIVKLVKKVKKLEGILKRRNVVLSDSEEEESEDQGRKSQDDPLVSLVQGLVVTFHIFS
ncbi:hypothetical protein Tco_0430692 [Tanacetum coccineum]